VEYEGSSAPENNKYQLCKKVDEIDIYVLETYVTQTLLKISTDVLLVL